MELLWSYIEKVSTVYYGCTYDREKVSTGMVDEKVTVISIFPEIAHFFGTEAKNALALAAIGYIHEGDSHILRLR